MRGGYTGKTLIIDLSSGDVREERTNERDARRFIGGKGLGAKMLWDLAPEGVRPLSPENPLIFITGPLTGTTAPTAGRWCVVTKSPLTGIFLDSQVGGYWGVELKRAGYDALVIKGQSTEPVYLFIEEGHVAVKSASDLWGLTTSQTVSKLRKKHREERLRIASIGPAGEKLVKFAIICIDSHEQKERGGQAGRGGAGAVMGSKMLKAIAVRGSEKIPLADPEEFKALANAATKKVNENSFIPIRRKYGTPVWINPVNEFGILPTRNFRETHFEFAENISGETMRERIVVADKACASCTIMCGKQSRIKNGKYAGVELEGPEYELLALLGSNCGISNLDAVAKASLLVDELGLDGISTGNVVAFAMECAEKGLIKAHNLAFGREDGYLRLIQMIAMREDIGDLLAEGVRSAAENIGKGAEKFAMHVKGMELPGYDPRGSYGMALAYATSDRGGCHQRAWTVKAEIYGALGERFSTEGRAKFVKETQDERSAAFSLVLCDFAPLDVADFVSLLNAATGFNISEEEYLTTGERIWNLTRMYSIREGMSTTEDRLPQRLYEPVPSGPTAGKRITEEMMQTMLTEYYSLRGWNENGIPTKEKLREMGLHECLHYGV